MKVRIDMKKSVEQNAQTYFEKAKKQRKKLEGAKEALEKTKKRLEDEKKKGDKTIDKLKQQQQKRIEKAKIKKEWFENFRWFYSSEGFLVIGGRDATTNEIVIKKHTDKEDVVFHTDMAGSPFFVIKVKEAGKEPTDMTLQESADATLIFSRAWKLGLHTTPTFYVKPDQVSKEPNPGEFLPKGAFMIRGKTNYINPNTDCAIGIMKGSTPHPGKIMCGPLSAVKENCEKIIPLKQGSTKPSTLAKQIKGLLGGELDEIIRILPSGNSDIKK